MHLPKNHYHVTEASSRTAIKVFTFNIFPAHRLPVPGHHQLALGRVNCVANFMEHLNDYVTDSRGRSRGQQHNLEPGKKLITGSRADFL